MTERRTELQPLLEGALLAAIAVVLVLLEMLVPFLAPVLIMVRPVPFAVAGFRQGARVGVLTVVVAALVSGMFGGVFTMLIVALVSGTIGLTFGLAFRKGYSASRTLALASLVVPLTLAAAVGIAILVMGINPLAELREILTQSLELNRELYGKIGLGEQIEPVLETFRTYFELMFTAWIPAVVVLVAVTQAWLNFMILRAVLTRLGHQIAGLPPFSRWQLPYSIVWLFIAGYAAMWLGGANEIALLTMVGENIMVVMSFAFLVHGLSLVYFFFDRWQFPKVMSVLILVTLAFQPLFSRLLYFAGMLEAVIQYRSTLVKRDESDPKPGKAKSTKKTRKKRTE